VDKKFTLALELREPKQIWKALLVIISAFGKDLLPVFRNQTPLVIKALSSADFYHLTREG
jgi:hypothetical protein